MKSTSRVVTLVAAVLLFGGAGCISFGDAPTTSGPAGMFVSTDKGENWQAISRLATAQGVQDLSGVSVYRIFTDPQDPKALYWASRAHGYFYSYDEGRTWHQPLGDFRTGFVYSIAVHPANRCVLFVTDGTRVMRTDDCSRSWTEVYRESRLDTKITSLVFNHFRPHQIFMAESNGDFIKSLDSGISWDVVHRFESEIVQSNIDPFREGTWYVATRNDGLYRSEDKGETWTSLASTFRDFPGALEYRRFVVHPKKNGLLYWISTYGILVSRDQGDTWTSLELITPPGSAQIYGFAVNPDNDKEIYYTATINGRSTFYKTISGGPPWITKKMPSGQYPTVLHVRPDNESLLYMGFTIPPKS